MGRLQYQFESTPIRVKLTGQTDSCNLKKALLSFSLAGGPIRDRPEFYGACFVKLDSDDDFARLSEVCAKRGITAQTCGH
jgi:hypothetical protein